MPAWQHQREKPRFTCQVPIEIVGEGPITGIRGVTRDVSETGVFFFPDSWHHAAQDFEFRTIMPVEITHTVSRRALCRARVVRVEGSTGGKLGVAARIEHIVWM